MKQGGRYIRTKDGKTELVSRTAPAGTKKPEVKDLPASPADKPGAKKPPAKTEDK